MDLNKVKQLRELLNEHHNWPDVFIFKFIYQSDSDAEVRLKSFFPDKAEFTVKSSTKNKFSSMTVKHVCKDSEEVFDIYQKASTIDGVISL